MREIFGVMELLCVLIVAVVTQMYPLLTLIELYVQRELILWCVNLGIKKNENTRTYIYIYKQISFKNA